MVVENLEIRIDEENKISKLFVCWEVKGLLKL